MRPRQSGAASVVACHLSSGILGIEKTHIISGDIYLSFRYNYAETNVASIPVVPATALHYGD